MKFAKWSDSFDWFFVKWDVDEKIDRKILVKAFTNVCKNNHKLSQQQVNELFVPFMYNIKDLIESEIKKEIRS